MEDKVAGEKRKNKMKLCIYMWEKVSNIPGDSSSSITFDVHDDGCRTMLTTSQAMFTLVNLNIFPRARRFLQMIKKGEFFFLYVVDVYRGKKTASMHTWRKGRKKMD